MGKKSKAHQNDAFLYGEDRRIVGVDDMVLLSSVSENAILENLKMRHASDTIYTYIGHVLVVVNPYKWLPIYDETMMRHYVHKARIDVAPHVFSVAETAYRTMLSEEDNQCVIISGESGAGKTEASKQIQNYIAGVSSSGEGVDKVKKVFLESNPLLESFGNAKTLRNNNSSRFGKYFELFFDTAGRPQGGKVTNYLLEKSRVVKPGKGERNFHIFYQLLAGIPGNYRKKWHILPPSEYRYLQSSGCYEVDDVDDVAEFQETMKAMQHVGIKNKQIELVLQTVAALLHLGNVGFSPLKVGDAEGSSLREKGSLQIAAQLLGLNAEQLEHALCYKLLQTMAPGGKMESYEVPQNPSQAHAAQDSIAKTIYDRLFDFLVERVNHALDLDKKAEKTGQVFHRESMRTVGILDIYGFEIFDKNGFEQFCINYVNEKLQQIFIELTLKSEQEEYQREGIEWTPIPFFNNKIVCDLIESKRPTPGIFLILDDTVKTMHSREGSAIDSTFLDKVSGFHSKHAHFSKRGKLFEIKHYAGDVQYHIDHFGDSNRDSLNKDIAMILRDTQNKLMQHLFPETVDLNDRKAPKTSGFKIRTQCAALVEALMECTPHYVRCLKSNDQKKANRIDDRRLVHQAKYLGLLENIKVRRAGYAYRGEYGRFLDRFKLLSRETYPDFHGSDKKGTKAILRSPAASTISNLASEVQFGKSMIFIRTPETYFALEKCRDRTFGLYAARIQNMWRKSSGKRITLERVSKISTLYKRHDKRRQRVSLYRPFDGDYLLDDQMREDVLRIVRFYHDSTEILFIDTIEKVEIVESEKSKSSRLVPRILLLTPTHVYLMEPQSSLDLETLALANNKKPRKHSTSWNPPRVYLRRRVALNNVKGLHLSQLADPHFILRFSHHSSTSSREEEEDRSHWLPNDSTGVCMDTSVPFGLFQRRHHCRFSGKIYCDEVCRQRQLVPDRGISETPARVHDSVVGFIPTESYLEDQLLSSERKSEFIALLLELTLNQDHLVFENSTTLQTCIRTSEGKSGQSREVNCHWIESNCLSCPLLQNQTLELSGTLGVPESYIKHRRKRDKARLKILEQKRAAEARVRMERQASREQARDQARLERLAEKKARKQAEREAKKAKAKAVDVGRQSSSKNVRKFGESLATAKNETKSSGVSSELAAILARRRAGE